jgi:hypothetical protein
MTGSTGGGKGSRDGRVLGEMPQKTHAPAKSSSRPQNTPPASECPDEYQVRVDLLIMQKHFCCFRIPVYGSEGPGRELVLPGRTLG